MKQLLTAMACAGLCLALPVFATGCRESNRTDSPASREEPAAAHADEHEGHEHDASLPQDLPAGLAALKADYQAIKDAFEKGDTEKAHEPLHNVGNLLEALPKLATEAGLAASDAARLTQAADRMFEAYGTVDSALHDGKPADYQAVSAVLDENMKTIESAAAAARQ